MKLTDEQVADLCEMKSNPIDYDLETAVRLTALAILRLNMPEPPLGMRDHSAPPPRQFKEEWVYCENGRPVRPFKWRERALAAEKELGELVAASRRLANTMVGQEDWFSFEKSIQAAEQFATARALISQKGPTNGK